MRREKWTTERVNEIDAYMAENKVSLTDAQRKLGFAMSAYYRIKKKMPKEAMQKRKYTKKDVAHPVMNINVPDIPESSSAHVAILLVPRNQLKEIMGSLWQS